MTSHLPNTFQNPNVYVDRGMSYFTDPELRVMLFTVRHIFGWQDRIEARTARISLSMYEKGFVTKEGVRFGGCGLTRPSIVKALNSLVELGFLERLGDPTPQGQRWRIPTSEPDWQKLELRGKAGKPRLLGKVVNGVYQSGESQLTAFTSASKPRLPKQTHSQTQEKDQTQEKTIAPNGAAENSASIPSPSKPNSSSKTKAKSKASPEEIAKNTRVNEIIAAWINGLPGGAPASNPYKNKTTRDQAAALAERGITPERVTQYTREMSGDPFWRGRLLTFHHMANNISAWLTVQPTVATNGAARADSVSDEAVTGEAMTADDLAAWDALEREALDAVSVDKAIRRIRRQA